ncbi:MAG TPA: DMT family transporter [Vicinamibacteria bacterium]|nr:DMT family transporter [Vicinamibacteria bacterium]
MLLVLASTVAYGSMAILAKIAFAGGVRPLGLLAFRFLLASLLFAITVPKASRPLPWPTRFRLWGLGGVFIVNAVAYFTALERTPASLVSVLVFTYPVMVMFLSALFGLDPLTVRGLASALLAVAGSALSIGGTTGGASASGVALALLAALLYAGYVVLGSRLLATIPTEAVARHVVGVSALLSLPWGAWRGELVLPSTAAAWLSLVVIGTVSTFVAMRAFLAGVERIGAARASVLSTLEVFVTVGLAALFLSEAVSLRQVAGAALVLAAVLLQNLGASRLGGRGRGGRNGIS